MLAGNPSCFDQMYTLFKLYIKSDVMPLVEKKLLDFGGKKMRVTKRDRASTLRSGVQSCTGEESIFLKKRRIQAAYTKRNSKFTCNGSAVV